MLSALLQNPMLLWLGAAAAPLVIHLLSRRKHREVAWAAVEFLLAALRKNNRRLRLEQWLLLAVRTLILALVALAVADLFLQLAGRKFVAGRRTHRVLVLDASYSMGYQPGDRTRFERATRLAAQIIRDSPQGDGFSVVLLGDPPRAVIPTPAFERETVATEIEGLALPHGTADLPATLAQIGELLAAARRDQPRLVQEEVLFLTDLGRVGWWPEFPGPAALEDFRRRAARLGEKTTLTVIDLGQPASDNLAVTGLRLLESYATPASAVTLEAEVGNFGSQARMRQLVEFYVDGRRVGEGFVDVPPGDRGSVPLTYRFDAPGDHVVEARLPVDPLDIDNHRWLSVAVRAQVQVLCVDGRPSGRPFAGAADYLAVALAPGGSPDQRSAVRVDVADERALVEAELAQYDAVFLAEVAQFTAAEDQVLRQYVEQGGGLVLFLSEGVQADNYNQRLGGESSGGTRLLPARLGTVVSGERPFHFDPLDYRHELVAPFAGNEQAGLRTAQIERYVRLTVVPGSAAQVALAFRGAGAQGDPAIVEEAFGRGRVALVALSADPNTSTLPVGPAFVPIVQELLNLSIRGRQQERNVRVGQPLEGELLPVPAEPVVEISAPGDRQALARLDEEDYGHWLYADTWQSGRYTVRGGPPAPREQRFAVNVDTRESDLAKLTPDELRSDVWPGVDFRYDTVWQNVELETSASQVGRRSSLARWFLWPALALLLLEPVLAWRFGRAQP